MFNSQKSKNEFLTHNSILKSRTIALKTTKKIFALFFIGFLVISMFSVLAASADVYVTTNHAFGSISTKGYFSFSSNQTFSEYSTVDYLTYGEFWNFTLSTGASFLVQFNNCNATITSALANGLFSFTVTPTGSASVLFMSSNGEPNVLGATSFAYNATSLLETMTFSSSSTAYLYWTTAGVALQLPFDNETGSTAVDWSGNGNNGIITGASRSYDGVYGMCLSFDGSDYVTVVDNSTIDLNSTIMMSAWIKPSSITESVIFDKPNAYGFYLTASGGLSMMLNDQFFNTSSSVISTGSWYHVIGYYDGSTVSISVNGTSKLSSSYVANITVSAFDLVIGDQFVGNLDEMVIANATYYTLNNPIAVFPYAYTNYLDAASNSWLTTTLTYNFTNVYIRANASYPITYAKYNFTDGTSELGLAYTVSSSLYTQYNGASTNASAKITVVSEDYSTSFNAAILQERLKIESTIQSAANVNIILYCEASEGTSSLTITNRFNIYGLGGIITTTIVGDGAQVAGGTPLDIMAQNSSLTPEGSSIQVDEVEPNFQHIHLFTHLYQGAEWDATNDVWDCPTYDHNTGWFAFGVDYMVNNSTWAPGWYVNITIIDGNAGDHGSGNDQAWVLLNCSWYNDGQYVKSDQIYAFYEAYHQNDTSTQFSLYIDLWLSDNNGNTMVAGHVSSEYYGMTQTGWWLWSNYGPIGGLSASSTFYDYLYDQNGNITSASNLHIFRVWDAIAKTSPGTGSTSCDNHVWAVENENLQIKTLPYSMNLTGIESPVFQPTTTPNMPLGFFASLGNTLTESLNNVYNAITSLSSDAGAITSSMLNSVFATFGISNFMTSLTSFVGGIGAYFATSIGYIGAMIITFFTLFANIAMFIITWFGNVVNAFISIGDQVVAILNGTSSVATGVGNIWSFIQIGLWSAFIPFIMIIYWFDSIDRRAKLAGGGWNTFFMGDINNIMSVLSFILDLAWRVVDEVINIVMRFFNVFM